MIKYKRWLLIMIFLLVAFCTMFFVFNKIIVDDNKLTAVDNIEKVDYLEKLPTGEKVYIKSIEIIQPTIWKGSCDGILYLKDGRKVEIDISNYGDFFGIKGEEGGLFSQGVLYKYTVK